MDHLRVGEQYRVFGMVYFAGDLLVLVRDLSGEPNWYPVQLFRVVDGSFPSAWKFGIRGEGPHGVEAIAGYSALVEDPNHYENLVMHSFDALQVFETEFRAASSSQSGGDSES